MSQPGRVDFYVLSEQLPAARLRFACRLAEKAYHMQHRVHLHAASGAAAAELDELLWMFRQGSFVPHEIVTSGQAAESPVTIGYDASLAPTADLLINLAEDVPDAAGRYARVAEIISAAEDSLRAGRTRFRRYQELGLRPVTHDMGKAP